MEGLCSRLHKSFGITYLAHTLDIHSLEKMSIYFTSTKSTLRCVVVRMDGDGGVCIMLAKIYSFSTHNILGSRNVEGLVKTGEAAGLLLPTVQNSTVQYVPLSCANVPFHYQNI